LKGKTGTERQREGFDLIPTVCFIFCFCILLGFCTQILFLQWV
jgi:hypothetical protein